MYIGYLNDRKQLGFESRKDIHAGKQILSLEKFLNKTKKVSGTYLIEMGKQVYVLIFSKEILVAILIFVKSISSNIEVDLYNLSFSSSEGYQVCLMKSSNSEILTPSSHIKNYILKSRGGSDDEEQEKLINSILAKTNESDIDNISVNKVFQRLLEIVISNQKLWRVLSELEKPVKPQLYNMNSVSSTDILGITQNKQLKSNFKSLSAFTSFSPMQKRVQRKRYLDLIKKKPTSSPTMLKSNKEPTPDLFTANNVTGEIQNINIAFNQFKTRMIQIGNQYIGKKQEYFFKQLNQCEIDRFKDLSTERNRITISNAREAETMLQSEFDGHHEPNSISRPTKEEFQAGNVFDGRFRKGILSNESDTLNENYTEVDPKLLISDETLQYQADQRKALGHKKPNKISMYKQGRDMGLSIVNQKHKHCNPSKPELPSSPNNVKHIINALELTSSELVIAKAGIIDGARIAWADKLNVPEKSISDQTALQGIIFLNENFTIERVN